MSSNVKMYEVMNTSLLRPYLPECTVLLKRNGAFPLDGPCRIAAYGSGVRFTVKGGTGSGEVNSRYFVTVEQGLKDAGFDVAGEDWLSEFAGVMEEARKLFIAGIRAKARREKRSIFAAAMGAVMKMPEYRIPMDLTCDAAIYVVSRICGEGNDRLAENGDFLLTDSEVRDIHILNSHYDRFMLVINTGGPVDLSPVMDVGNILVLSQLGVETGAVLADILLGRSYPSGKLTDTWAAYDDYCSIGEFGNRDDTRYKEGIYVGYRYFDTFGIEPLFPFGYGLGYTDFSMKPPAVRAEGAGITVTAEITNTGSFPGKETLQVYVSCPGGRLDREVKSLAGFAKTDEIEPGCTQTAEVTFDIRELAAYDEEAEQYILEKGSYIVLTGTDSRNVTAAAVLELRDEHVVRCAPAVLGRTDFEDLRSTGERSFDLTDAVHIEIDLSGYAPEGSRATGSGRKHAEDAVLSYLSAKELAFLNVGAFEQKGCIQGVVGDSSTKVAGAAGESTSLFSDFGIRSIIMADGPAGVRIARLYYEDRNGCHSIGPMVPESMLELLPAPLRFILGDRKSGKAKEKQTVFKGLRRFRIREQYCTAIPIATAIAQSFNTGFAEICGDVVGSELEQFGIDLWLAPALNVHRNVLCGRNFEYYSEDPLLSGKFAAAITRAVQSYEDVGVTIKHYAANSQETNRYASNSMVSERAMREIYMKGFGICIREADPMALMTSYNLLNGIHTSESRALTDIARDEFGFDGIIMTDWVVGSGFLIDAGSKYGAPDAARVAAAGCSLFMPGCAKDYKQILDGLKDGTVTEGELCENAGWLLHVINRLDAIYHRRNENWTFTKN